MKIIGLKFGQSEPYYIRINKDGSWDESYNPYIANTYERLSLSKAQEIVNRYTTFVNYTVVLDAKKEYKKFDKWLSDGCIRRSFEALSNISRKYTNETPEQVLDWWIEYNKTPEFLIRYQDYTTWPAMYTISDHIHSINSWRKGDQQYITATIYTRSDGKFVDFKRELDHLLPKINKVDEKYILRVFEHTLSEYDIVSLVGVDDIWSVTFKYRQPFNGTLKECFEYLRQNYYYD